VGADFVRVHRTEIANVAAVVRVEAISHGDGVITFRDGSSSVLTRTYRTRFLERWKGGRP
jgi:two-component system LytT family response regulator